MIDSPLVEARRLLPCFIPHTVTMHSTRIVLPDFAPRHINGLLEIAESVERLDLLGPPAEICSVLHLVETEVEIGPALQSYLTFLLLEVRHNPVDPVDGVTANGHDDRAFLHTRKIKRRMLKCLCLITKICLEVDAEDRVSLIPSVVFAIVGEVDVALFRHSPLGLYAPHAHIIHPLVRQLETESFLGRGKAQELCHGAI
mmetsp:Transcript_11719/g.14826  ORF Transcript_11719/g.14826 Transcript_11719/m.14826 type:complete len:200 (-) Transcript_11719:49-648(-)